MTQVVGKQVCSRDSLTCHSATSWGQPVLLKEEFCVDSELRRVQKQQATTEVESWVHTASRPAFASKHEVDHGVELTFSQCNHKFSVTHFYGLYHFIDLYSGMEIKLVFIIRCHQIPKGLDCQRKASMEHPTPAYFIVFKFLKHNALVIYVTNIVISIFFLIRKLCFQPCWIRENLLQL